MCLGIPGQVTRIDSDDTGLRTGSVRFGGITKVVCLACVPEAQIGDYVVVHAGFAIARLDEDEALRVFEALAAMGELGELERG